MTRLDLRTILPALVVVGGVGCAHAAIQRAPVTYVPTNTPGVMYVVVHPNFRGNPPGLTLNTGDRVSAYSDYVLLCDGRGATGMKCEIATEAAMERVSYSPHTGNAAKDVDEMVGALAGETGELHVHNEAPAPELRPEPVAPAMPVVPEKAEKKKDTKGVPPPPAPPAAPTGGVK